MKALASQSPNVIVSAEPVASALPSGLDAVFIRQNYHDLYDKFMGPADVPAFNKAVFAALKPGGVYVVLDHAAIAGSGVERNRDAAPDRSGKSEGGCAGSGL